MLGPVLKFLAQNGSILQVRKQARRGEGTDLSVGFLMKRETAMSKGANERWIITGNKCSEKIRQVGMCSPAHPHPAPDPDFCSPEVGRAPPSLDRTTGPRSRPSEPLIQPWRKAGLA